MVENSKNMGFLLDSLAFSCGELRSFDSLAFCRNAWNGALVGVHLLSRGGPSGARKGRIPSEQRPLQERPWGRHAA